MHRKEFIKGHMLGETNRWLQKLNIIKYKWKLESFNFATVYTYKYNQHLKVSKSPKCGLHVFKQVKLCLTPEVSDQSQCINHIQMVPLHATQLLPDLTASRLSALTRLVDFHPLKKKFLWANTSFSTPLPVSLLMPSRRERFHLYLNMQNSSAA